MKANEFSIKMQVGLSFVATGDQGDLLFRLGGITPLFSILFFPDRAINWIVRNWLWPFVQDFFDLAHAVNLALLDWGFAVYRWTMIAKLTWEIGRQAFAPVPIYSDPYHPEGRGYRASAFRI